MIIKNKQKSFTLIELLVVIVIIGILAGVIMISTSSSIDKANFAKAQAFSSTVQNELLSNLVSEWTFDNASNIGEDTWGNNHGTLYGSAGSQNLPQLQSTSECVFGTCLKFDGTDDYVDCGNGANLNMTDKITISVWLKLYNKVNSGRIVHKGGQTNNYLDYSLIIGDNGKISFGASKTSNTILRVRDVDSLELHTWYYIVGIFDEANYAIYLNGNKKKTTNAGLSNSNINTLNIGRRNDGEQYFNGIIDDVRIYNAALSSAQIKQNYIAGLNSMLANGNISKEEYNERINNLAYNDNNE